MGGNGGEKGGRVLALYKGEGVLFVFPSAGAEKKRKAWQERREEGACDYFVGRRGSELPSVTTAKKF